MGSFVRKMPEDVGQPVTEHLAQAFQNRAKPAAIRAEEIAIGNDIDDAALRLAATHVVASGIDLARECRHTVSQELLELAYLSYQSSGQDSATAVAFL